MIPVPPLADEFCRGHVWRSLTINRQFRTQTDLLNFVQKARPCAEQDRPSLVLEAISDVCGIDRTQYLRLHSMLPFMCFVEYDTRYGPGTGSWLLKQIRSIGLQTPRLAAFLCRRCVEEDIGFWHVSYWRRAHQLPGLHSCAKHPDVLLCAVVDRNPFARLPEHWVAAGRATEHPAAQMLRTHPLVQRFVEICEAMLDGGRCWHSNKVRSVLRRRAAAVGVGTTRMSKLPSLSDLAIDQFPKPFLAEVFPTFQGKRKGEYFLTLDGAVGFASASPSSLALAMTLLYESNDEALNDWRRAGVLVRLPSASPLIITA